MKYLPNTKVNYLMSSFGKIQSDLAVENLRVERTLTSCALNLRARTLDACAINAIDIAAGTISATEGIFDNLVVENLTVTNTVVGSTVATASPVQGTGLSTDPVTLIDGVNVGDQLSWNGSLWNLDPVPHWFGQQTIGGAGINLIPVADVNLTSANFPVSSNVGGFVLTGNLFQVPRTGVYQIAFDLELASIWNAGAAVSSRVAECLMRINGLDYAQVDERLPLDANAGNFTTELSGVMFLTLTAGDNITFTIRRTQPVDARVVIFQVSARGLQIRWVSP